MAVLRVLFAAAAHAHLRSGAGPEHPVERQALETSLSRPHMVALITNPPPLAARMPAAAGGLVERVDIEPFSDFSAK